MAEPKEEIISLALSKRVVVIPGVDSVRGALESFKWPDYLVCCNFLLVCVFVGLYFGFFSVSKTAERYLLGGRKLKIIPVSMSLTASCTSGLMMLKVPSETYLHGTQHLYLIVAHFLTTVIITAVFLPVLYRLRVTSIYEYLEKRFCRSVRLLGSLLFIINMTALLPVVMYVPVLTFRQATNLNGQWTAAILCSICIFNISLGGVKSVVWSDTIHLVFILSAICLLAIKATLDFGNFNVLLDRVLESTHIEAPNLDLASSSKYTFWSATIGGSFYYLHVLGTNQNILQKYLSLPSLKSTRITAWTFFLLLSVISLTLTYLGLLIYATFYHCDPLKTKLAPGKDHLLPLLVMTVLGDYPTFSGIFIIGLWSACLSSWSTTLNAVTAAIVEDFYPIFFTQQNTEKSSSWPNKVIPPAFGVICLCLTVLMNRVDSLLQISDGIVLVTSGPLLGLFTAGVLLPWINKKGALIGSIASLIIMTCLSLCSSEAPLFHEKPLTTDGCRYHFVPQGFNTTIAPNFGLNSSFYVPDLWYTLMGSSITIVLALVTSLMTESSDPRDIDPVLLAPLMKRIIRPREFPNEPIDGIIYAFHPAGKGDNVVLRSVNQIEL